jgi:hypothetical protein
LTPLLLRSNGSILVAGNAESAARAGDAEATTGPNETAGSDEQQRSRVAPPSLGCDSACAVVLAA